jgi:hypothetical protein
MGDSSGDEAYSPVIRVYDEAGNVIEMPVTPREASSKALIAYTPWTIFIAISACSTDTLQFRSRDNINFNVTLSEASVRPNPTPNSIFTNLLL